MPKRIVAICLYLVAQFTIAAAENRNLFTTKGNKEYQVASMIELIANPEKYHNKYVYTEGYLTLKFEQSAIFLSADHAKHLLVTCALWVEYKMEPEGKTGEQKAVVDMANIKKVINKYVYIAGRFNMNRRGQMLACAGCLEDVVEVNLNLPERK